jgi:hypothetical protein
MIVNPYNKNIIITKSFKQTQIMKQMLKLQYISLFSTCNCRIENFSKRNQEEVITELGKNMGLSMVIDEKSSSYKSQVFQPYRFIEVNYLNEGLNRARIGSCIDISLMNPYSKTIKRNSLNQRNKLSRKSLVFDKSNSVIPDVSEAPTKASQYILHSLFFYNFEDLSK